MDHSEKRESQCSLLRIQIGAGAGKRHQAPSCHGSTFGLEDNREDKARRPFTSPRVSSADQIKSHSPPDTGSHQSGCADHIHEGGGRFVLVFE